MKTCRWCHTGKPPEIREPFKNPNCSNCAQKPDAIDGKRLRSIAEIKADRKPQWIDWDKVKPARGRARAESMGPKWRGARA